MLDTLHTELRDHIDLLAMNKWFTHLVPVRAGASTNAFFAANEPTHRMPAVARRDVAVPMPDELRVVYERYADDTEFATAGGWVFLSEAEMARRRVHPRVVDLGFTYAGMGHVTVLSYDPETRCVFMCIDGGANDWDRRHNHESRMRLSVDEMAKQPFAAWWHEKCAP